MGYVLFADHRPSVGLAAVAVLCAACLGLPAVLGAGEAPPLDRQAVLQIELRLPAGAAPGGRATQAQVIVESAGGDSRSSLRQAAPVPGVVSFEAAAGTVWQVRVEAPGYWSQPVPAVTPGLLPGAPPEPARAVVDLLPAGRVAGELRPPADRRMPAELALRLRSAPGVRPVLEEAQLTCPVTAEGRFECAVPAGQLDLRLRAHGFLTHSFWGVKVPAGGVFAAGPLALRPGASVVGWVAPPGPNFRYQDCTAVLEPYRIGNPPSLADVERAPALGQTATVNSRGYFEITGVAPGGYRLVVRHPRWAPAEVAPLNVLDGAETEIHSIALRPPADLEVRLEPARSPGGGGWQVTLLAQGTDPNHLVTVRQGPA
ncbi:MAG TPA: carboxypeptidase-like regulatory domain-containing protein, partial [Thermoanaerobaculia bacterium]|nr:carboxypeptidase-like regulatory domain-containing protein [Thermoanaerobaculia bacterium]